MPGWLPRPVAGHATLGDLREPHVFVATLRKHGLSEDAASRAGAAVCACANALVDGRVSAARPAAAFFVPGRIEVLGKHTDYAGGRSLVCATERGFTVVATARDDRRLTVRDARSGAAVDLVLDTDVPPVPGHWSDYVRTVARRLVRDFDHAVGADICFASDLPPAAGVSSSSALVIGVLLALAGTGNVEDDPRWGRSIRKPEHLAEYAAAAENGRPFGRLAGGGGVGTLGGSQDHTAILCARPGQLARFSFAPVRAEGSVPLPADRTFAVASSGVRAEKSAAARDRYNRLAELAADAARIWHEARGSDAPHLGAILAAGYGPDLLQLLRGRDDLHRRAAQFFEEAGSLIPGAFAALEANDIATFGGFVARSQQLAESHLGNQIPETVDLVRLALDAGANAASAFGAGFGGSVWALVPAQDAADFVERWRAGYGERHQARVAESVFFTTRAGPPVLRIV